MDIRIRKSKTEDATVTISNLDGSIHVMLQCMEATTNESDESFIFSKYPLPDIVVECLSGIEAAEVTINGGHTILTHLAIKNWGKYIVIDMFDPDERRFINTRRKNR